jgi:succinyl-CoA synthetase beta subunit
VIAKGLIEAAADLHVPLIVRLKGTNVEIGNQLLRDSGLKIIPAEDLDDAARLAVQVLSE